MRPDVVIVDALEALMRSPRPHRFRVGLALPMSGVLGMSGPSALEAAVLAGREINAARTASEREIELVVIDSGQPRARVAQTISDLAASASVGAFVGLHTSHTREYVEQAVAQAHVPYIYTSGHEGISTVPGFYCSGETPTQLLSGLARIIADRQVQDWAILGTDFVWPHVMRTTARSLIEENSGRVVLDRTVPIGGVNAALPWFLKELVTSRAGGIIINLPGRELAATLLAIRSCGLDQRLIRFSAGLEENVLYAINGDSSGNLYSNQHSFEALPSPRRIELNDRYRSAFGDDSPVLNSWAEHCYDGLRLIAGLEQLGLLAPEGLGHPADPDTPAQALDLRPHYDVHLGVAAGLSFRII